MSAICQVQKQWLVLVIVAYPSFCFVILPGGERTSAPSWSSCTRCCALRRFALCRETKKKKNILKMKMTVFIMAKNIEHNGPFVYNTKCGAKCSPWSPNSTTSVLSATPSCSNEVSSRPTCESVVKAEHEG